MKNIQVVSKQLGQIFEMQTISAWNGFMWRNRNLLKVAKQRFAVRIPWFFTESYVSLGSQDWNCISDSQTCCFALPACLLFLFFLFFGFFSIVDIGRLWNQKIKQQSNSSSFWGSQKSQSIRLSSLGCSSACTWSLSLGTYLLSWTSLRH